MILNYGSVCSGIEAATVAWHELGWQPAWFAEIEKFPSALLEHHYPNVPNLGDMTKIRDRISAGEVNAPDVLVGGTPCQAFSYAGLRNSLDDDRGQLTLEYVRLANAIDSARSIRGQQPVITVWENVPGVLNTKDNAFGCFLGALAGSGCELQPPRGRWGNAGYITGSQRQVAWRVLDAQYFGLAQRRKRVFVIASAMAGFDPTEILFERNSVPGNPAPSRGAEKDIAGTLEASTARSRGAGTSPAILTVSKESGFAAYVESATAATLKKRGGCAEGGSESLIVGALDTQCGFQKATMQTINAGHLIVQGTQDPLVNNDIAHPLGRNHGQENAVCYSIAAKQLAMTCEENIASTLTKCDYKEPQAVCYGIPSNWIGRQPENGGNAIEPMHNIAPCQTKTDRHAVAYDHVRRLIPIECERLQGFPDDWTKIPFRNKPAEQCPDGPRYAALGNSMAVTVMRWIGERIAQYLQMFSMSKKELANA